MFRYTFLIQFLPSTCLGFETRVMSPIISSYPDTYAAPTHAGVSGRLTTGPALTETFQKREGLTQRRAGSSRWPLFPLRWLPLSRVHALGSCFRTSPTPGFCRLRMLCQQGRGAALALRAFSDLEGRQRDIWRHHKVIRAAAKAGTKRHTAVWEGDMSSAQGSAADKTLSTDGMSCAVRGRPHPSPLLRWPLDTRSVANATSCILPSLMVIHLNLCSGLN